MVRVSGAATSVAHHMLTSQLLRRLALREVLSKGLGLVDGLLLALRVVRVVLGRGGVAGGLAAAETCKSSSRSSS